MRYTLILILLCNMCSAFAGTAVERFVDSGGEVVKTFPVESEGVVGLVIKSPEMDGPMVAYTNTDHDYLMVGLLFEPELESGSKKEQIIQSPFTMAGLYSDTNAQFMKYALDAKSQDKTNDGKDGNAVVISKAQKKAIDTGHKANKDKYLFLNNLVYIGEGNENADLTMYILYDTACSYCRALYNETRGLLEKYHFKWVPVAVVGNAKDTARDLKANSVFSSDEKVQPSKRHIGSVIKNGTIISNTGYIELATPTAIIYDPKEGIYKVASGITGRQVGAFYNYVKGKEK